jgi:cell shape-determining protein MreC
MMTYLVIGLCIILLIVVIYISAKPISMGIEARRNINHSFNKEEEHSQDLNDYDQYNKEASSISNEILKLNDLKQKGLLTQEEYEKAKEKLLS